MWRSVVVIALVVGALMESASWLAAHDLFLRPRDFFARPGSTVQVRVLNGSFTVSEAIVAAERLRDLTIVGPAGIAHPDRDGWTSSGKESAWTLSVGGPGTYVLGASTDPKTIKLTGAQFNDYLREEGLADVVSLRRRTGILNEPSNERYAKHVKALIRVTGLPPSTDTSYRVSLGYPAELVPLDDPYRLRNGTALRVRALVDGAPIVGQVVIAGGRTASGARIAERHFRTDRAGVIAVPLGTRGAWYVKFIRMVPIPKASGDSVNYESKWATLTFAVGG